mmetsp:Transcript_35803/g.102904  ORF Transcript_35803/g.102904 Transcript_35803/m.102904 type:complete len:223 (+) Transcript_35803:392-1060(+)
MHPRGCELVDLLPRSRPVAPDAQELAAAPGVHQRGRGPEEALAVPDDQALQHGYGSLHGARACIGGSRAVHCGVVHAHVPLPSPVGVRRDVLRVVLQGRPLQLLRRDAPEVAEHRSNLQRLLLHLQALPDVDEAKLQGLQVGEAQQGVAYGVPPDGEAQHKVAYGGSGRRRLLLGSRPGARRRITCAFATAEATTSSRLPALMILCLERREYRLLCNSSACA